MRLPKMARPILRLSTLVAASSLMLSACSNDATAPTPAPAASTPERASSFQPTAAAKQLYGIQNGTYVLTFDPTRSQSFGAGGNHIDIPANAVCKIGTSGYGPSTWNLPCETATLPVTITIKIANASSDRPTIEFFPALRFNPTKNVQLFMYAPKVSERDPKNWVMYYCPDGATKCVNEQLTDSDLTTYVDNQAKVLFRRIKHFSGYVVAERGDNSGSGSGYFE